MSTHVRSSINPFLITIFVCYSVSSKTFKLYNFGISINTCFDLHKDKLISRHLCQVYSSSLSEIYVLEYDVPLLFTGQMFHRILNKYIIEMDVSN